jgi:hypothetical protein
MVMNKSLERMWKEAAVDGIDLAQDREQWRALANMVMNLRVPLRIGNFLTG